MRVEFDQWMKNAIEAPEAQRIIEDCVHCGICTAVCPTYEVSNHELDSPRGRIYLIKNMLQGAPVSQHTRSHLDRCLTCRACETACPSGVEYGRLIDIGRHEIDRRAPRSFLQRLQRTVLRHVLQSPRLLRSGLQVAWALRELAPDSLRSQVPARPAAPASWPKARHARRVLTLSGCVQGSVAPGYDVALARILDRLQVSLIAVRGSGCCGAISQHLGAPDAAAQSMRRNIDACWPLIEAGAEAIVMTSSGCGTMVADYAELLKNDPDYAAKAQRVSALLRDPVEVVSALWSAQTLALTPLPAQQAGLAFHAPCSLQHGLKLKGRVELLLQRAGYELSTVKESHMCCGSAGTYSILQPELAEQFGSRKMAHLMADAPPVIASSNVGCILHLQKRSQVPVRHWLELLADRLPPLQELA